MSDKEKATEPDTAAPAPDELKTDELEQISGGVSHAGADGWISIHNFSAGEGHQP